MADDGGFDYRMDLGMSFVPEARFGILVARGDIPGWFAINKFGYNNDIDTNSDPEDVWDAGGLWVPPTAARTHDIASDNVADAGSAVDSGVATGGSTTTLVDSTALFITDGLIAVGNAVLNDTTLEHSIVISFTETTITCHASRHGANITDSGDVYRIVNATSTGASVVHVFGLDSDMNAAQEFVVTNGTTDVPTVRTYWRVHRIHIDGAAGRTVSNVGVITATAQTDGTVTAQMNAGEGQTLMAVFTVPADKTFYMTKWSATINRPAATTGAMATLSVNETPFASVDGSGSRVRDRRDISVEGSSVKGRVYDPPKVFLPQTDIWIRVENVTKNDTVISSGFDGYLIDGYPAMSSTSPVLF